MVQVCPQNEIMLTSKCLSSEVGITLEAHDSQGLGVTKVALLGKKKRGFAEGGGLFIYCEATSAD